jgi:hypothetical protein
LRNTWYGCSSRWRRLVLQAGAPLVDPAEQQRRGRQRQGDLEQLRQDARTAHDRTSSNSNRPGDEAVQQVDRNPTLLQQGDAARHSVDQRPIGR